MPEPQPLSLAELLQAEVDLATLSDEELAERRTDVEAAVRAAREGVLTGEVTALLVAGAQHVGTIAAEVAERDTARAELVAQADEAMSQLDSFSASAGDDDEATEGDEAAAPAEGDTPAEGETPAEAAPPEADTNAATEPTKEVAAAVTPRKPINRQVSVPARHQPVAAVMNDRPQRPILRATGEMRGVPTGYEFSGFGEEFNRALFGRWIDLRKSGTDGVLHPHYMATLNWKENYPPEQRLTAGDPDEMNDKILRYVTACREGNEARNALRVASGGVPGPAEPRYEQITYGQADRPLRDSLPNFLMERGQTVFNSSPTLADVLLDQSAGAIGTVTNANDVSGVTKDIQEISAPTATTVTVEAETMRWSQGNFADRFYPERTAAFMKLGMVAYARHNDALRLADIKTNCTKYTDTPAVLGAYRDLKRQFLGLLEELEDLVRDFEVPTRVLLPEYVPAMLAADLTAQQPGDDMIGISEEQMRTIIEGWDPNVNITWLKDSVRGRLSTTPSGQSPRTPGFDADVEWCMFPEGAFAFGDGGQLDLGILRDTTVSALNKFQTFYESWEALLPLVSKTLCFWNTSSLCVTGNSQVAQNLATCSPQGS